MIALLFVLAGCDAPPGTTNQGAVFEPTFVPLLPQEVQGKRIIETFPARVVGVTDGDTIKGLKGGEQEIKIRLEAIDAPESKQPFGNRAKQAMSDLVFGKPVNVLKTGEDRWGRTLAFVIVDDVNVSQAMIRSGYAWHYADYSKSKDLAGLEQEARTAKRGLWADKQPIPPWDSRKTKR